MKKDYNYQIAKIAEKKLGAKDSYFIKKALQIPECIEIIKKIGHFLNTFNEMKAEKFDKILSKYIHKLTKIAFKQLTEEEKKIISKEFNEKCNSDEIENLANFYDDPTHWGK